MMYLKTSDGRKITWFLSFTDWNVQEKLIFHVHELLQINRLWSSHQRCSIKKVFLKFSQNSQENTCAGVSFLIKLQALGLQLYQKGDSGKVVFCKILKNTFFYRTTLVAASANSRWKTLREERRMEKWE